MPPACLGAQGPCALDIPMVYIIYVMVSKFVMCGEIKIRPAEQQPKKTKRSNGWSSGEKVGETASGADSSASRTAKD